MQARRPAPDERCVCAHLSNLRTMGCAPRTCLTRTNSYRRCFAPRYSNSRALIKYVCDMRLFLQLSHDRDSDVIYYSASSTLPRCAPGAIWGCKALGTMYSRRKPVIKL